MSRYSPSGIGRYEPQRNPLVESLNDFSDSILKDVRERRRMQFDASQAEIGRQHRDALWQRQDEAAAARERERIKREEADQRLRYSIQYGLAPSDTPQESLTLPDGTAVNRYEPVGGTDYVQDRRFRPTWADERGDAQTRQTTNRLSAALGGMVGEDPSLQPLIDFGDPDMMRGVLGQRLTAPYEDRRTLNLYEQKARIDRRYAPPQAPPAPRTITVGGLPYTMNPNGTLAPMTLADGSAPPLVGPNRRKTVAEMERDAFAATAADAAMRLGDFLEDDDPALESALGMRAPGVMESMRAAVPFLGNTMSTEEYQRRRAATYQMSEAWLRYTSGAAVPDKEVERFAEGYSPEAGDKPGTIAEKRAARRLIVSVLRGEIDPITGMARLDAMGVETPEHLRQGIRQGIAPGLDEIDPDILELLRVP